MRISINVPKEDSDGRFRMFLPIPLGLLKMKFLWRHMPPEEQKYAAIAGELVKALRQYKRENGPWDLVEVHSHDGGDVRIRV